MNTSKDSINKRFVESIEDLTNNTQGLTKKKIAEKLGIKQAKFSEILNNRMGAGIDLIANFCIIYNIDISWMLTGEYKSMDSTVSMVSEENKNNYMRSTDPKHINAINNRLLDENNLLRKQLTLLQDMLKDQQELIEAFKSGQIIIPKCPLELSFTISNGHH